MSTMLGAVLDAAERASATQPAPLAARRRAASALVRERGLPTVREEAWKYTNLKALDAASFRLATAEDGNALTRAQLDALDVASARQWRMVIVNGALRADLGSLESLPEGVTITSLAAVLATGRGAAEDLLVTADDKALTALNTATFEDGILIEVAPGVELDHPLTLVFVGCGDAPVLRSPRITIRVGRHARARIIEEYLSVPGDTGLTNTVTDIVLADGAELHHHRLQNEALTSAHLGRIVAVVGHDACLHSDSVAFGSSLMRLDIDIALRAQGARCVLNGLFAGREDQHLDHHTTVDHEVGDTHSEERYRGILDDRSRGVFNGKVVVHKDAQKISARQASNNLLLSRQAEIDTKPELEIYADDVICAHGATVGELDQAALFYLRSRGIAEADARALLIYAFAEQIIRDIPLESLRRSIEHRFIGHGALSELSAGLTGS